MPMVGQKYEIARMCAELHRDNYRRLLRIMLGLNVLILLLILAIIYVIFFQPETTYYTTTPTGLVMPLMEDRRS